MRLNVSPSASLRKYSLFAGAAFAQLVEGNSDACIFRVRSAAA